MASGGFSDNEDGPWGKDETQTGTEKEAGRPKRGADTPEDTGPQKATKLDEEDTQEESKEEEEEDSDSEDDPVEKAEASTDTQKEHVTNKAENELRDRTAGDVNKRPAKASQSKKRSASKKDSNDLDVIDATLNLPTEKLKGSDSVKMEAIPLEAVNTPAPTELPNTLLDMQLRQILQKYILYIAAFLVAVIAIAPLIIYPANNSRMADDKSYNDYANTTEPFPDLAKLDALKTRFPSQDETLWSTLSDVLARNLSAEPCTMLSLASSVPFASYPNARSTLTELASALPWMLSSEHLTLHHRQFTTVTEEQAREAIEDIMRAWSTDDVIVIPDVDSMPGYVMDAVRTTCQSNGVGHVVVTTSEERPRMAESVVRAVAVRPEQDEAPLERLSFESPEESLTVIRRRFRAQPDRVWQVVEAAILHHIAESDPVKPAVVILGAPPGAHRTVDRLAETLARVYTEKPMTIDSRQFANVNAARAKLHLDRVLGSALLGSDRQESGILGSARAVVLTRLEALPGDAAMLFHGYCDHSDAQYKIAAYFFTVHCSEEIDPKLFNKQQERKIYEQLQRAWRNLPETHLGPLLGRITPLMTVVRPEGGMELPQE